MGPCAGARHVPAPSPSSKPVLVIASGNPHKVAEITAMLAMVEVEVRQQPEGLEIEETGTTYAANARLKAEAVAALTGEWTLADDSGVEVDALGGRPGIYSARYAGSDPERIQRLLRRAGRLPLSRRPLHQRHGPGRSSRPRPCWRPKGSAMGRSCWNPRATAGLRPDLPRQGSGYHLRADVAPPEEPAGKPGQGRPGDGPGSEATGWKHRAEPPVSRRRSVQRLIWATARMAAAAASSTSPSVPARISRPKAPTAFTSTTVMLDPFSASLAAIST